jgi:hypothetical protein
MSSGFRAADGRGLLNGTCPVIEIVGHCSKDGFRHATAKRVVLETLGAHIHRIQLMTPIPGQGSKRWLTSHLARATTAVVPSRKVLLKSLRTEKVRQRLNCGLGEQAR